MSRTITMEIPTMVTINGAQDAPDSVRVVKTDKWTPEFCLTALIHGISQKIGDTWSVSKKDPVKTKAVHANMEAGDWSRRVSGNGVSIDALVDKMSADEFKAYFEKKMAEKTGK